MIENLTLEVIKVSDNLEEIIKSSKADVVVIYTEDKTLLRDYPHTDVYNLVPQFTPEGMGVLVEPAMMREVDKRLRSIPDVAMYKYGKLKTTRAIQKDFEDEVTETQAISILANHIKSKLDYFYVSDNNPIRLIDEMDDTEQLRKIRHEILESMKEGWKHGTYSSKRCTSVRDMGISVIVRDNG